MGLVPYMTSFCCCMGLEVGTKIIGYLHVLVSLTVMGVCSYFASQFNLYVGTAEDVGDHVYTTWARICTISAVFSTLHTALGLTLLYGAYKRSLVCVRVWVCVMCVVVCVGVVFCVVVSLLTGLSHTGSHIFIAFIEGLVFFGFIIYSIICVNSYYMLVRNTEEYAAPKDNY